MTIAILGAHRVGKSTLAKVIAERQKIAFLETSVGAIFKELGYDPRLDYDFKTRLFIQRKILDTLNTQYAKQKGEYVTDRSPLDALAYLLADVTRQNVNGELTKEIMKYSNDCYDVLNKHFNIVMLIQPGIPLVEEEGKAPVNVAYIEHINSLIFGLLVGGNVKCNNFYLPRSMTSLEERYESVMDVVERVKMRHEDEVASGSVILH